MATEKGGVIAYKHWTHQAPSAVFLLIHGLGAHAGRWDAAGNFFLKHGVSSYAVELRDAGQPPSADLRDYYSKILDLREIALKEKSKTFPVFLIGESLGAVVSFLLCADSPVFFNGLVCISPAFTSRYKVPLFDCIKMLSSLFYNPKKEFPLLFDSSVCTRDADCRGRLDCDPCEYRSASSRMIFQILAAQARARRSTGKLTTPTLFLTAGNDLLVDPRTTRDVFNSLTVKDKEIVEFPDMYHSLSIDIGKESVFEAILKWTAKRMAP